MYANWNLSKILRSNELIKMNIIQLAYIFAFFAAFEFSLLFLRFNGIFLINFGFYLKNNKK